MVIEMAGAISPSRTGHLFAIKFSHKCHGCSVSAFLPAECQAKLPRESVAFKLVVTAVLPLVDEGLSFERRQTRKQSFHKDLGLRRACSRTKASHPNSKAFRSLLPDIFRSFNPAPRTPKSSQEILLTLVAILSVTWGKNRFFSDKHVDHRQ